MAVTKSERRLLIVSELPTFGRANLKWLYSFLDVSGIALGVATLGPHYAEVKTLSGTDATKSKFISTLCSLCRKSGTKAVDVIVQLHGASGKLWFQDGSIETARLADEIEAEDLRSRLRLLYSLACYGYTHTSDWIRAGFRTASGARKVNASSATDYPAQLLYWVAGKTYKDCVAAGNAQPGLGIADRAAKAMKFTDADSYKLIQGEGNLRISWNAQ